MLFLQERIRNMTWIKERWWKILETLLDRKVVRQLWSKWSRWWVAIIVILCDHSPQNTTKTQQPKSKFHEPYLLSSAFLKRSQKFENISHLFWCYWVNTTVLSKQVRDFFKFCGLLIISELYQRKIESNSRVYKSNDFFHSQQNITKTLQPKSKFESNSRV